MKTNVSPAELADVLRDLGHPDAARSVADHIPPPATAYDSSVLETLAAGLLREASSIVLWTALRGAVLALVFLGGLYLTLVGMHLHFPGLEFGYMVAFAVLELLAIGMGQRKAFALRVQAQTILCQVQLEKNTRAAASALSRLVAVGR